MDDPYHAIPHGAIGTVVFVDDLGTIHMEWQNGSGLGLVPDIDKFKGLSKLEKNKSKGRE